MMALEATRSLTFLALGMRFWVPVPRDACMRARYDIAYPDSTDAMRLP
jgi:hypothetical protein